MDSTPVSLLSAFPFLYTKFYCTDLLLGSSSVSQTNGLNPSSLLLAAIVKGASLLNEPQEFWTNSETKISVPMMRVTGNFEHKFDNHLNLSVIKIAASESVFLLLLQPINNEDLTSAEEQYSLQPSYLWLQKLSLRYVFIGNTKVY